MDGWRRRSVSELEELVCPLSRVAHRSNLVGVTDWTMLDRALAPYDDAQVRYAVAQTASMVKAGSVTKSPIGWLVTKARAGDEAFFPPEEVLARRQSGGPAPSPAVVEEEVDVEAETAVAAVEADGGDPELDALDSVIRSSRYSDRLLGKPGALHAARVAQWRRVHPRSPAGTRT